MLLNYLLGDVRQVRSRHLNLPLLKLVSGGLLFQKLNAFHIVYLTAILAVLKTRFLGATIEAPVEWCRLVELHGPRQDTPDGPVRRFCTLRLRRKTTGRPYHPCFLSYSKRETSSGQRLR